MFTLPKCKALGDTLSCPGATPIPERPTAMAEFEALLAMDTEPVAVPPPEGLKVTVTVTL